MKSSTAIPALLVLIASQAFAGANPHFTLPMHGIWPFTFSEFCTTPATQGIDCSHSGRPTVDLPPEATGPAIFYLFVHNHAAIQCVQTAFEWAPWTFLFGQWRCIPGSHLHVQEPHDPGGPFHGYIGQCWPCVTDPSLLVVGFMVINITGPGCISQVEPYLRISALDCNNEVDELTLPGPDELRLGRVCVGSGGHDACDALTPVLSTTWGGIKAQYQDGSR